MRVRPAEPLAALEALVQRVSLIDEGGSERRNLDLRARRAQLLQQSLLAAGVPANYLILGADDPAPALPSAGVRWIEGATP